MPSPELTMDVWRAAAVALCEYACGYDAGRRKDDPVYLEVTEKRDGPTPELRRHYSSCGDLAHWLYMRLGIREPWLNRTDDNAFRSWKPGANVSNLWGPACPFDRVPPDDPSWAPEPGDVVLIWNTGFDAHVMVSLGREGSTLRTANYGAAGMSPLMFPGSLIKTKALTFHGHKPFYDIKQIQRYLPLADAVKHISTAPDLTGAVLTGEQLDAIEKGWNASIV